MPVRKMAAAVASLALLVSLTKTTHAQNTAPPPAAPPAEEPEKDDVLGELQFLAGGAIFDVSKLNDRLTGAGYGKIASPSLMIGGHSHAALLDHKLLLGGTGAYFQSGSSDGPGDLSAYYSGGWGGFEIGWQVVDTRYFGLAPMLLLGGYGFGLNLREARSTAFGTMLTTPNHDSRLLEQGPLFGISVPFEVRIPFHDYGRLTQGLVIGLRPGFLYGIQLGDWKTSNGTANDGPKLGLTGGFLALSVGGAGW